MKLFNSESDRELWIRLNAERQIEWEKGLRYFDTRSQTYKPTLQALNPRTIEQAMIISKNQCEYDEQQGELRYTMEQLLTMDIKELTEIGNQRHQKWCKEFEKLNKNI